jgi:hypothetical protein
VKTLEHTALGPCYLISDLARKAARDPSTIAQFLQRRGDPHAGAAVGDRRVYPAHLADKLLQDLSLLKRVDRAPKPRPATGTAEDQATADYLHALGQELRRRGISALLFDGTEVEATVAAKVTVKVS